MPRLVCVDCQRKYRIATSCAYVVVMFNAPAPRPYQIWLADVWRCPGCGRETVAGFANNPIAEHWHANFNEQLQQVEGAGARVVYEYER